MEEVGNKNALSLRIIARRQGPPSEGRRSFRNRNRLGNVGNQTHTTDQYVEADRDAVWRALLKAIDRCGYKVKTRQDSMFRVEMKRGHGLMNSPMTLVASLIPQGSGTLISVQGVSMDTRLLSNGAREVQREASKLLGSIYVPKVPRAESPANPVSEDDLAPRLARLKSLYDQGLLSDSEYESKRNELLNEI
jgi:hypothetical protein